MQLYLLCMKQTSRAASTRHEMELTRYQKPSRLPPGGKVDSILPKYLGILGVDRYG